MSKLSRNQRSFSLVKKAFKVLKIIFSGQSKFSKNQQSFSVVSQNKFSRDKNIFRLQKSFQWVKNHLWDKNHLLWANQAFKGSKITNKSSSGFKKTFKGLKIIGRLQTSFLWIKNHFLWSKQALY